MVEQRSIGNGDVAHEARLFHCLEFLKHTLSSQGLGRTRLSDPLSRITEADVATKLGERNDPGGPSPFPVIFAFTECLYEAFEEHFTTNVIAQAATRVFYQEFMKQYVLVGNRFFRKFGNLIDKDRTFFALIKPHLTIPDGDTTSAKYGLHVAFAGYGEALPALCAAFAESNQGYQNLTAIVTEYGAQQLEHAMRSGSELSGVSITYERLDLTTGSRPSHCVYAGHPNFTTEFERGRFTKIMDALMSTTDRMVISFYHSFEKEILEEHLRTKNDLALNELTLDLPQSELTLFAYFAGLRHYCFGLRMHQRQDEPTDELKKCDRVVRRMYALDPTDFEAALKDLFHGERCNQVYDMITRAFPQTYRHTMVVERIASA